MYLSHGTSEATPSKAWKKIVETQLRFNWRKKPSQFWKAWNIMEAFQHFKTPFALINHGRFCQLERQCMWPGLQLSILWKLHQEMFSPGAARLIALPNRWAADWIDIEVTRLTKKYLRKEENGCPETLNTQKDRLTMLDHWKGTLLCLGLNTSSSHKASRTQSVREGIDLEASPYRRSHSILPSSIGKWLCIKNWTPSSSWGPATGSSVVLPWHDKQSTHEMLIPALVKWRGFTSAVLICLCKRNVVVVVVSKTLLPACTFFFSQWRYIQSEIQDELVQTRWLMTGALNK